ncbi:MAG: hypothetical protein ACOX3T_04520 [Bdellovibrionota bacterium]
MCGGEGQCCPVNRCIGEGGGARCGCSSDETEYTDNSGKKACCKTGRIYNEQYCCSQDLCNGVCCEDGETCDNGECKGEYNCMSGENFKNEGCTPGNMTEECCGGNCMRFGDDIYRCSLWEKNYGKPCENDVDCDNYRLKCESGRCVIS